MDCGGDQVLRLTRNRPTVLVSCPVNGLHIHFANATPLADICPVRRQARQCMAANWTDICKIFTGQDTRCNVIVVMTPNWLRDDVPWPFTKSA